MFLFFIVERNGHEIEMLRKKALSNWFQQITEKIVEHEISTMEQNDQIIFSLLTGMYNNIFFFFS